MVFKQLNARGLAIGTRIAFVSSGGTERSREGHDAQARQILDQRYAQGEIGDEEYQRIRRGLG